MNQKERIDYTDEEIQKMGERLAKKHRLMLAMEAEKRSKMESYNDSIKDLKAQCDSIALEIERGWYEQDPIRP